MDSNTQFQENDMKCDEENKFIKSFETRVIHEQLSFDPNVCKLFQSDDDIDQLNNLDPHDVFGGNSNEDVCVFQFNSMSGDSSESHQKADGHFIPIQRSSETQGFYAKNDHSSILGEAGQVKVDVTNECLRHLTDSYQKFDAEIDESDELDQKYPSTSISLELADLKDDHILLHDKGPKPKALQSNKKFEGCQMRINLAKQRQMKFRGFALRADVMNKNMFRAFRRECKSLFTKFLKDEELRVSRSKKSFKSSIIKFSDTLLKETSLDCKSRQGFASQDFTKYLSLFVNLCAAKKHLTDPVDLLKVSKFSEILYSYSHKKLFGFVKVPEVSTLFKMIFNEKVCIDKFISKHSTLKANSMEYKKHIETIMREI